MPRSLRIATLYLVLAAMMLRAVLPAGWMPNFSHPADSVLMLCPMHGTMPQDSTPDGPLAPANDHAHDICPFAVAAPLAGPFAFAPLSPPSFAGAIPYRPAAIIAAAPTPDYQAKSPRAPPAA